MKTSVVISVALVLGSAAASCGVEPASFASSPEGKPAYVSIETPAGGEPMLVIRYPWKVHARSSVEVRSYVKGEEDSPRIQPLYFRDEFMKDEFTVGVYKAQDDSASVRVVGKMTRRDIEFTAIGQRNLFDRPSVVIACRTDVVLQKDVKEPEQARRAVYPLLGPWASDDRTLFLSLPEEDFTEPAKIRIWFLRGGEIVWSEVKQWPGLPKKEVKK